LGSINTHGKSHVGLDSLVITAGWTE
jgi:hypothetical protein